MMRIFELLIGKLPLFEKFWEMYISIELHIVHRTSIYLPLLGGLMDRIENFRNKLEREMRSGFIALLLLHVINQTEGPIYGYSIIKKLNGATRGRLRFKEGTVYPILRYLHNQKFLTSFLGESPTGAPRKYYIITGEGKEALDTGISSWQDLQDTIISIFEKMEVN